MTQPTIDDAINWLATHGGLYEQVVALARYRQVLQINSGKCFTLYVTSKGPTRFELHAHEGQRFSLTHTSKRN